ncbi:MAG: hypothetical protein QM811_01380 [Pirellulales bacterium]
MDRYADHLGHSRASGTRRRAVEAVRATPRTARNGRDVARAIQTQEHLLIEAGTGVGKSFAYLVPAILAACQDQLPDTARDEKTRKDAREDDDDRATRRVVISTHTIALQEQLLTKDIPFLRSVIPLEFSAVLVKGRGNYVSLRRLKSAQGKGETLYHHDDEHRALHDLGEWVKSTNDGTLSDMPARPPATVWDDVRSDSGNCLGRNCPTYADCFYYAARRRMQHAQILIVNHSLYFSDLALRREGASLLPPHQLVIFDEAHTVEGTAGDHLGLGLGSSRDRIPAQQAL